MESQRPLVLPLANNARAHDYCATPFAITRCIKASIGMYTHLLCILHPTLPSDGIGTSRIDDNRTNTSVIPLLKHLSAHSDRGSLELVFRKYRSRGTWCF
jgi:hypothetical protein